MSKGRAATGGTVRPNIQISHTLNGRVKDFAEAHDINTSEAYRVLIEVGLENADGGDVPDDLQSE